MSVAAPPPSETTIADSAQNPSMNDLVTEQLVSSGDAASFAPRTALALLHYDVASTILTDLTPNELLNFALTCRSICNVVIPRYIWAHIALTPKHPRLQVITLLRKIAFSVECGPHFIRHLEVASIHVKKPYLKCRNPWYLPYLFQELFTQMQNLRSLSIIHCDKMLPHLPRIPKAIVSLPHLRSLHLANFSYLALNLLDKLSGLQTISLASPTYNVHEFLSSTTSALQKILVNSRHTLEEIRLFEVCLNVDLIPSHHGSRADADTNQELCWPHVHTLELPQCIGDGWAPALHIAFPSVRTFASPEQSHWWTAALRDASFLTGLESLHTKSSVARGFTMAGYTTRRLVIGDDMPFDVTNTPLKDLLPRHLVNLQVSLWSSYFDPTLERFTTVLPMVTPHLKYFFMRMNRGFICNTYHNQLCDIVDDIRTLPLEYLCITWDVNCGKKRCDRCVRRSCPEPVAKYVERRLPSLQALTIRVDENRRWHWKKKKVEEDGVPAGTLSLMSPTREGDILREEYAKRIV
ncbi:hypothetical protein BOTBODRAFT_169735 [Botryobasidium botryosum FD-172 SS1]|uniref:F-box domain-containing protein n=1 Tax=Botryobasidium botryosum (strain FD-172 SS1) TaxID=930990 RepID=A0A067MZM7_BOTB1|nr:hypothetical protein BOTBODRAFT_169735 [Botryobasidium botryosum FD-172 SS1]